MQKGDSYIFCKNNSESLNDEYVFGKILSLTSVYVLVEEIHITTKGYNRIAIGQHRRRYSVIEKCTPFPEDLYTDIANGFYNIFQNTQVDIDNNLKRIVKETTSEDCYYYNGTIEHVMNYVDMFRPSWNVDTVTIADNQYYEGHYRFGVNADKYTNAPDKWKLVDKKVYSDIKMYCSKFIDDAVIKFEQYNK